MLISSKTDLSRAESLRGNVILHGDKGIGKRMIAEQLAGAWLGVQPEEIFRHPDFALLEPDGSGIKKEQIDEMAETFSVRPSVAEKRVFLVDDASSMNAVSSNALLKPLEDNSPWTAFILVAHGPMLDTIRSRCVEVRVATPSEDELRAYLGGQVNEVCLLAADGRVGLYRQLSGKKDYLDEMSRFLTALNSMRNKGEILSATGALKEKDKAFYNDRFDAVEMEGFLNLLQGLFFRHMIALASGNPDEEHPLVRGGALTRLYDLMAAEKVWGELEKCRKLRARNKFSRNDMFSLVAVLAGRG